MVKCNGVKNKETFLSSQKCWAWHIFCCRETWRHNVSVCHLAGRCKTTGLACLSCMTRLLPFYANLCVTYEAGILALTGPRENGHEQDRNCFCNIFMLICGSKEGAVVRAPAFHLCSSDSIPVRCHMCG